MTNTNLYNTSNKKFLFAILNEKLPYSLDFSGVCKIFEEYLKKSNPSTPSITYDISQLFDYIDNLTDLSCMVYHFSFKSSVFVYTINVCASSTLRTV